MRFRIYGSHTSLLSVSLPSVSLPLVSLLVAGAAHAQLTRGDISAYPSNPPPETWFATEGDAAGDADDGADLTDIHVDYKTVNGEEWAVFRFQTDAQEENVTSRTGVVGYLDVDAATAGYEARFFTLRSEHFDEFGCGIFPAIFDRNCAGADVVLVVQTWDGDAWQTEAEYGRAASGGRAVGARGRDDQGCASGAEAGCEGWVFDNTNDLTASHAPSARSGAVVVAFPLSDVAPAGSRPTLLASTFDQWDAYFPAGPGFFWSGHEDTIFADGNPCHDPNDPYFDEVTGECTDAPVFDWADPITGPAIATPASVDLIEAVPGGLKAAVITVHGPTMLELWWREADGRMVFTGQTVAATEPGVYLLVEGTPRSGGLGYALVDRGIDDVFALYASDGSRLRPSASQDRLIRRARGVLTRRDAARAPVTSGSQRGALPVVTPADEPQDDVLRLVDVSAAGGVVSLPARHDGERVAALWVDGKRHRAFACADDVVCTFLPPADAAAPLPLHRAAVVEVGSGAAPVGRARPVASRGVHALGRGAGPSVASLPVRGPSAASAEPALLVERRRLPHPELTQWWPAPLEEGRGIGWIWRSQIPEHHLTLDDTQGEIIAIELEALAWDIADAEHAFSASLDGAMLEQVRFTGPRAQVRFSIETSYDDTTRTLTFATVDGVGAAEESLFFRGALVERIRSASIGGGPFHVLVKRSGALHFADDVFAIVRSAAGSERAVALPAGSRLYVDEGDELAAVAEVALSSIATIVSAPSPGGVLASDTVVLVGSSLAGFSAAKDALAPWLSSLAATGSVTVVPAMGFAAALGGGDDVVQRTVSWLGGVASGPDTVVVVGSATERPERELPSEGALYLTSPRRYADGFNYASDAAPALESYASGGRLVAVTRLPVRSRDEAAVLATRLAQQAEIPASASGVVVAGWSEDFSASAAHLHIALRPSQELGFIDGYALGQAGAIGALNAAVQDGAGSLWFVGHGSSKSLGGSLASPARFKLLATEGARPLTLVGLSCLAGNVGSDYNDRMPEALFRGDSVVQGALLGSAQLAIPLHDRVGAALGAAVVGGDRALAEAWRRAMASLLDDGVSPSSLAGYALVGDPRAPLGGPPD